jgi:hypothetical protein
VSETPPPELPQRKKLAVEQQIETGGFVRRGAVWMYAVATVGLAGLALYMALVEGHEPMSAYVAGPAIGAVWFALRTFMTWGSNARG